MAMENSVMANRRTVDEIVGVHDAFLQRTLEACLLTNRELVRTLTKLMTTCLMFADQMKLFTEATRIVSIWLDLILFQFWFLFLKRLILCVVVFSAR